MGILPPTPRGWRTPDSHLNFEETGLRPKPFLGRQFYNSKNFAGCQEAYNIMISKSNPSAGGQDSKLKFRPSRFKLQALGFMFQAFEFYWKNDLK